MATATIAVIALGFVGVGLGMVRIYARLGLVLEHSREARANSFAAHQSAIDCRDSSDSVRNILIEASRLKAARTDSPFEQRDKIPSTAPARYVPIARRRMAAEMESQGPITHDAKVRENNARAMETAG